MFVEFSKVISKPVSSFWTWITVFELYPYLCVSIMNPNTFLLLYNMFDSLNTSVLQKRLKSKLGESALLPFHTHKRQLANGWFWNTSCLSLVSSINNQPNLAIVDMLFRRNLVEAFMLFPLNDRVCRYLFKLACSYTILIIFQSISSIIFKGTTRLTRFLDTRILDSTDCTRPMAV